MFNKSVYGLMLINCRTMTFTLLFSAQTTVAVGVYLAHFHNRFTKYTCLGYLSQFPCTGTPTSKHIPVIISRQDEDWCCHVHSDSGEHKNTLAHCQSVQEVNCKCCLGLQLSGTAAAVSYSSA